MNVHFAASSEESMQCIDGTCSSQYQCTESAGFTFSAVTAEWRQTLLVLGKTHIKVRPCFYHLRVLRLYDRTQYFLTSAGMTSKCEISGFCGCHTEKPTGEES